MAEEKKKDKEEAPKLVEVYGDDVVKKEKDKDKKEDKKEENTKEKVDKVDEKEKDIDKDKGKTPEEIVEEIIEERQAFKTEVVDQEEKEEKPDDEKKEEKPSEKVEADTTPQKSEDETAFEDEIGSQRSAVKGVFGVGVFVFLIIFGLTGWAFYLKSVWLPKETVSEVIVEASPIPNTTPEPKTTVEQLTRDEITLDVLNGSGVSGLAGKTATTFEDLGYEIGTIGNGDDVDATELYIQEDLEDQLGNLLDDVEDELGVASISGYLDSDADSMGKVVLGN